ncbi:MAG: prenyltransferase [Candidatus Omnitrophota bacterium]|jgi:1,4-dihydroxy-2-naphthoate octaprenyltransferase|nr:MAG: prenyltransferase [Candidatus Omnitrophota bacterium]
MGLTLRQFISSLRLPFVSSSLIPFIFGSIIFRQDFKWFNFIFGIFAVLFAHLGANVFNDYCDSRSGCDWKDLNSYGFFGGSKLIQQGKLSERYYLFSGLVFMFLALVCMACLFIKLRDYKIIYFGILIVLLSVGYSLPPLKLSYRGWGEIAVFILFGQALVMGGYYLQSGIFPDFRSFMLSLPLAFLITAILFCNEIPDFDTDRLSNKRTWVVRAGPKYAYFVYILINICSAAAIFINVYFGFMPKHALLIIFIFILPLKATFILRKSYNSKEKLLAASRLAIITHNLSGIGLILATVLR